MRALLLHLAIAGPAAAVWPEQQALDCKLRKFAHEYCSSNMLRSPFSLGKDSKARFGRRGH